MYDLIIVGAGFAGLVAAIKAARSNLKVAVFEHMDSAGKKIKLTGNGKCNIGPEKIMLNGFHSKSLTYSLIDGFDYESKKELLEDNPLYNPIATAFNDISVEEELAFFRELGIDCHIYNQGYYPISERAVSVLDALLYECKRLDIDIKYNMAIRSITKNKEAFIFDTKSGNYKSKKVLLATGGKSYKNTGSDGSGLIYAKNNGIKITEITPVLVPLISPQAKEYELGGIRVNSALSLYINGKKIITEFGQLQLTDYGLSGICIFNLSSYISGLDLIENDVSITVDFAPEKIGGYLYLRLKELRANNYTKNKSVKEVLKGLFHEKIICAAALDVGIDPNSIIFDLSDYELNLLTLKLKTFRFVINGLKGFDMAQCSAGGIDFSEVNTSSFESKRISNLFFAGEILDINGNCGGYNLLFAYYSATKAVASMVND